jgi:hypothetical protein
MTILSTSECAAVAASSVRTSTAPKLKPLMLPWWISTQ